MDFLINMMKPKTRAVVQAVCMIAGIIFLIFLFTTSLSLVQGTFANTSAGLRIPLAYV
ncbi:hypothetical protein LJC27_07300, partial [Christensenellaceae bacterium OttesenSCG-928-M15]|nr:hypothetical protein [Christensenellaceae bacterium OttesenSCG-928-M15]